MITYDRYTELLSKTIWKTITEAERKLVEQYEAATPKNCPKCGANMWTFLKPHQVCHDVAKCSGKSNKAAQSSIAEPT